MGTFGLQTVCTKNFKHWLDCIQDKFRRAVLVSFLQVTAMCWTPVTTVTVIISPMLPDRHHTRFHLTQITHIPSYGPTIVTLDYLYGFLGQTTNPTYATTPPIKPMPLPFFRPTLYRFDFSSATMSSNCLHIRFCTCPQHSSFLMSTPV